MSLDLAAEKAKALRRLALAGGLAFAWTLRVPAGPDPWRGMSVRGQAEVAKALAAAKPSSASVSWVDGGAPLDQARLDALQREAASGTAGPAVQGVVEDARKAGLLDKPMFGGKSLSQIMSEARGVAAEANAHAARNEAMNAEAAREGGFRVSDDPGSVVPQSIVLLQSQRLEDRRQAAMTLCENRYAKWPRAVDAIPALEEAASAADEDLKGYSELALKRIRFWEAQRKGGP